VFAAIREKYGDVEHATTMDAMKESLRSFEENHPELCEPIESPNQFYGWSRGANLLSKYVQWIYLPAVKDPSAEQDEQKNTALGKLLQRSVRSQIDFSTPVSELRR